MSNRTLIAQYLRHARNENKTGKVFWAGWWAGLATQLADKSDVKTGNQVNYVVGRMVGL